MLRSSLLSEPCRLTLWDSLSRFAGRPRHRRTLSVPAFHSSLFVDPFNIRRLLMSQSTIPLRPKNVDGKLRVIVVGRVSTEHQDTENIRASFRFVEEHLTRLYHG